MVQGGEARCGTGYGVGKREGLHRSDHRGERMRGRRPPWRGGWATLVVAWEWRRGRGGRADLCVGRGGDSASYSTGREDASPSAALRRGEEPATT